MNHSINNLVTQNSTMLFYIYIRLYVTYVCYALTNDFFVFQKFGIAEFINEIYINVNVAGIVMHIFL